MRKTLPLTLLASFLLIIVGCKKEFDKGSKYERPEWLAGKLFTQIKDQADLSTFAKCLQLTGYDTIINTSGSYTVFAPDNAAFDLYFQSHPGYSTVEDIPAAELLRIVKYHIVQNPWSTDQLKSLDIYGWIDSTDITNDKPRGFKRETLLREKDRKFGISSNLEKNLVIVDTLASSWYRRQATDSRKFAPIFFKEYFSIYDLNLNDYAFYFGRPFDSPSDMYFVSGKIIKKDIFAENGFVHIIDRVVEPLQNAFQILNTKSADHSYSKFLDLVNTFPSFVFDVQQTNAQPGADQGKVVDSLFNITYPELTFDITSEKTKAPAGTLGLPGNVSIRYHHGLIAPTNTAFDDFVNEFLVGPNKWGNLQETPHHIRRMMVNSNMASGPLYPTDFTKGFYNGENDLITLDQNSIIQKQFGSNCTFVGVNKMVVPRAFSSVTGPVYLLRGYSRIMYAIEASGLLPALKRENQHYMLYVESDANLRIDSSFMYNAATGRFSVFLVSETSAQQIYLTTNDLRTLILNHIGTEYPTGIGRKEYIRNLAGNYIIFNNQTNEVSGIAPTTYGYKGLVPSVVIPDQISTNADNGKTFDIKNWFNFSAPTLYLKISSTYPNFQNLLKLAGLTRDKEYRYTFISDNVNYTVFVPNDAALASYRYDTLTTDELRKFLMMHFVQGDMIFTDGKKAAGYYETARVDEKSTTYTTVYTKIYIDPGTDVIRFNDKNGNNYETLNESAKTNMIAARNLGTGNEAFPMILSNAVIHEIDKVLLFNQLDTK
jgi:uncharacterized surface protein with fasciclin (FAS1) repeats